MDDVTIRRIATDEHHFAGELTDEHHFAGELVVEAYRTLGDVGGESYERASCETSAAAFKREKYWSPRLRAG